MDGVVHSRLTGFVANGQATGHFGAGWRMDTRTDFLGAKRELDCEVQRIMSTR